MQRWLDRLAARLDSPFLRGLLCGVALLLGMGAGFSNVGPFSSLLEDLTNPLHKAEVPVHFTTFDELEATDGSGLDEVPTTSLRAGTMQILEHSTSGATLFYRLESGSPTQNLPSKVVPADNGSSGLYWQLKWAMLDGVLLEQSQTDNSKFYQRFVVNNSGIKQTIVDQTAVTITD